MIDHAEQRGRNTYALRKAAREGAGGGLGPVFPGKGITFNLWFILFFFCTWFLHKAHFL